MDINDKLTILIDKYKNNPYVTNRLINYIENLLPVFLKKQTSKYGFEKRKIGII